MLQSNRQITIGITGNIGSGKSVVSGIFREFGAQVVEGDVLGREVVEESPDFRNWLRIRFGNAIFSEGALDRAELGRIVFNDEKARSDLDREIWLYIEQRLEKSIETIHAQGYIAVVDAALIYEWSDGSRYDIVIAIVSDPDLAVQRAAKRMGLPVEEMKQRHKMQISQEEKAKLADIVIRNDGTLNQLNERAREVWLTRIVPLTEPEI